MLSRDELGRLTRVTMSQGDFVQYRYNDQNRPLLEKTLFEGMTRDREESLAYFAAQKRQREYNVWLSGKSDLTSRHFANNASSALDQTSIPGGGNCDLSETACIPSSDDFWGECARNPTCFGFMDDVNSFISNLANWLEGCWSRCRLRNGDFNCSWSRGCSHLRSGWPFWSCWRGNRTCVWRRLPDRDGAECSWRGDL
jgi:YD repeat-containing protein